MDQVYTAIRQNHRPGVQVFIQHFPEMINSVDPRGCTLLSCAISWGRVDIVDLLLQNGADPHLLSAHAPGEHPTLPLEQAMRTRNARIMDSLFSHGVDPDTPLACLTTEGRQWHLLDFVVDGKVRGDGIAEVLLSHRATLSVIPGQPTDMLGRVLSRDDVPLLRLLLSHGADPNEGIGNGAALLHWARPKEAVETLLEHGADPNLTTSNGYTALHFGRSSDIVQLLLQHGADPNARDGYGATPGWYAARDARADLVYLLEKYGGIIDRASSTTDSASVPKPRLPDGKWNHEWNPNQLIDD